MAEFSAGDTALSGFRIAWRHPRAVAVWAVLNMVVSLALTVFVTMSAGPAFEQMATIGFQPNADPTALLALMRQVAPTYAVLLIGSLVYYAVLYAAMNRVVLRPREERFGYLRLASDELRQLGLFALLAALGFAVYVAIGIVAILIVTILALAMGGGAISLITVLELVLVAPALIGAFIFLGVRFSLASPQTFVTGRIDLPAAWRLTRGRFWPLLGTYAIAFALSLVVLSLTLAIAILLSGVVAGGLTAADGAQSDFSSVQAIFTPSRLVRVLVSAIGTALGWPITMTPPAVIYRAIAGQGANGVGRVFD